MINRDLQTVSVITFTTGVDSYGQTRTSQASTRNVEMAIYPYSHSNVNNPKFLEYELIALTKDNDIDYSNSLQFNNKKYDIKYIIKSARHNQLFLTEVK